MYFSLFVVKNKLDQSRKTGGGPAPTFSAPEQALAQHLQKYNSAMIQGVSGGLESECGEFHLIATLLSALFLMSTIMSIYMYMYTPEEL